MARNILITAGGTSEPIDNVRCITNTSTGRLGSLIADAFAGDKSVDKIFYVCASTAVRPQSERVTQIVINTVADLQNAVNELMEQYTIDAVIHSMAVRDYTVRAVSTTDEIAKKLTEGLYAPSVSTSSLEKATDSADMRKSEGKLSSSMASPVILLEQAPKILPQFREKLPKAIIVGFKLLSAVPREELFDVALRLLEKNGCDFVLANDATEISGDNHVGYLLDGERTALRFDTKQAIASGIADTVIKELNKRA